MAGYFFDTSGLAKRYHPELGTLRVLAIFAQLRREVRISKLSFIEIQSVFAAKVRAGVLNQTQAGSLRAQLMVDIAAGDIEVFAVTAYHFASAEKLIGRHGFHRRLRTLDALQLAVALELVAEGLVNTFVAADKVLCEAAALEGLSVLNPEIS